MTPAPPPGSTEHQHGAVTLRSLPDWPSFHAGNDGFIYRTVKGETHLLRPVKPRKLAYSLVSLYRDDIIYPRVKPSGRTYWCKRPTPRYIHVLVASVWLPPKPGPEYTIDHENEDKHDNRPANLRWLTGEQNTLSYYRNHPLVVSGERNGFARLSDDQARHLLSLRGTMTQAMAAGMFGVSPKTVSSIWRGERWKHLSREGAGQN